MKIFYTTERLNAFNFSNFSKTLLLAVMLLCGVGIWGQTTYTWIGGNGAWNVPTNWSPTANPSGPPSSNTNTIVEFSDGGTYTVTNIPTTAVRQFFVLNNTNVTLQAATTNTLSLTTTAAGTNFVIEAGSSLSNTGTNVLTIATSTSAGQIYDISGTLNLYGGTFTAPNNATSFTTVSSTGIINHFAGTITAAANKLVFAANSNYNYLATTAALTIPTATWNPASQVNITGVTSGIPAGLSQNFGNILWNCGSQSGTINLATFPSGISGTFEVRNTNNQILANALTGAKTWTGDLLISGGRFAVRGGTANVATSLTVRDITLDNTLSANAQLIVDISSGATAVTVGLTANRDFTINLTQNATYANLVQYRGVTMTENITVGGNFTQTGNFTGQIRENAATSGTQNFIFQNGTTSVYSATKADIFGPITIINITSATVDFGNSILTYTGNFALTNAAAHAKFGANGYLNNTGTFSANNSGNTLTIGSQDGIMTSGGTGNIRSSSTRTYNAGTNLIYTGTNGQNTGNAQPAAATGYIQVDLQNNSDQITFTNATLSGSGVNVRLRSGSLANAITYTNGTNSILTYEGVAAQTTTDNEFPATNGPRSLVINNPNGVTLHAARTLGSGASTTNNLLVLTDGILSNGSNLLTIANTNAAAITGGTSTSYVAGALARAFSAATGAFNYPIGKASFNPLSVNLTAATATYSAEYFDTAPTAAAGTGLVSLGASYWRLQRISGTDMTSSTVTLTTGGILADSRIGYSPDNSSTAFVNIGGTGPASSITSVSQTIGADNYYTVGTGGTLSGTITAYTTLTSIANALQTMLVTSDVIFELPTSYAGEAVPNLTVNFAQFNTSGGDWNVTIRPASGSTNFLTAGAPGSTNPLINLNGIDRLTIDGRAGGAGSSVWTFRNTQTTNAGPTFQFIDNATNNTLTYLTVEGQNVTATSGTVFFTTASSLGNSDNTISNCHIRELTVGGTALPVNAIFSLGTATFVNARNTILNNEIYNFFLLNNTTTHGGINISTNNTAWTIEGNSFYQTASRTFTAAVSHYVININNTGIDFVVRGNYIGGSQASAGGSAYTASGTTAGTMTAIYFNPNTNATGGIVENNVIRNISWTKGTAISLVAFIGIRNANGHTLIKNNTVGDITGTGSITVTENFVSASTSASTGIYIDAGNTTVEDNKIGSVTLAGGAAGVSHSFYGMRIEAGLHTIQNNIIGSETTANSINTSNASTSAAGQFVIGIQLNSTTAGSHSFLNNKIANLNNAVTNAAGNMRGISTTSNANGVLTITGNQIYNLTVSAPNTGTGVSASNIGILMQRTAAGQTISQNTIYGLTNNTASAAIHVCGIHYSGPTTGTNAVSRNFIHSLSLNSSSVSSSIIGINALAGLATYHNNMIRLGIDAAGNPITNGYIITGIDKAATNINNFYYNSVYIGGSAVTGTATGTYAFRRSASTTADVIKNNIFINDRSNSTGTGPHYAIAFTALTGLSAGSSNNNLFHVNTAAGGYVGLVNVTQYQTYNTWKTTTSPIQDATSFFGNAGFFSAAGDAATVNLHINPSTPTQAEGNGVFVSGFDIDIDGDDRSDTTPDIGADEGEFTPQDVTAPAFGTITLANICNTATTANGSAVITDPGSGVETGSGIKPRIYYKKTTNLNEWNDNTSATDGWKYAEATNAATPFTFTLDLSKLNAAIAAGETIQYFVVAQDEADVPNVGISNSLTFTAAPSSVALTSAAFPIGGTPPVFAILPCSGTVTVGTGGNYTTLTTATGLFQAINEASAASLINGNLTVNVTSSISTEDGVNGLNEISSPYTILIQSSSAINRDISGTYNGSTVVNNGLFRLNGADRVTFNGGSGSNRYLTFRNTNTNAFASTFNFVADASNNQLNNCIIEGGVSSPVNGVICFATGTSTGNDNNLIDNCDIRERTLPSVANPHNGIYSLGTSAAIVNSGNTISNCNIFNYYNSSQVSCGVLLSTGNTDWDILSNRFYQELDRTNAGNDQIAIQATDVVGANTTTISNNVIGYKSSSETGIYTLTNSASTPRFIGIQANAGNMSITNNRIQGITFSTNSGGAANFGIFSGIYLAPSASPVVNATVTGNTIGSENSVAAGTKITITGWTSGGTVYGVRNMSAGSSAFDISNNKIGNVAMTCSAANGGILFYGISSTTGSATINNNIIGNLTTANGIQIISATGTANPSTVTGIACTATTGVTSITGNKVANMTNPNTSTNANSPVKNPGAAGITAIGAAQYTISGNEVYNLSTNCASTQTTYTASVAPSIMGIALSSTSTSALSISGNKVYGLSNTHTTNSLVTGIYYLGGTNASNTIEANLVHSLSPTTHATATVCGILLTGGTTTNVRNNMIRLGIDAAGGDIPQAHNIYGIQQTTNNIHNIYYNSVYIGGSGVGTTANNTYAFRKLGHNNADNVRNNIFFNARSNNTTGGKHYGVHFNVATAFTFSHNLVFANGTGNVLGGAAAADYATLPLFNAALTFSTNNISANPNFTAPTAGTPDLHISGASPAESAGVVISGVEDDFDATGVRTGYPQVAANGGGTAPDMGADETDVTPVDVTPPTFVYTNIPTQSPVACPPLAVTTTVQVTVNDVQSGISLSNDLPRMYFRRRVGGSTAWSFANSVQGTFVSGNTNSSVWSFTIDYAAHSITAATGDEFEYYFVAQDLATVANIGTSQSDGTVPEHSDVATIVNPADYAFPASGFYTFGGTPLSGTVTVGGGGTYTSLTQASGLFYAINTNGLNGNLRVEIISNTSEDGNQALNQWAEYCGTNYRVTIVPSSASVKTLTGSLVGMGMFGIYASRVTIDGSLAGSGRYLKFVNTASTGASENSVFRFGSGTALIASDTLRNCDIEGSTQRDAGAVVHMHNISGLVIENNLIHGSSNWATNIIRADGSSSITIKDNDLYNFMFWSGGVGTRSYGILAPSGNGSNWNIIGNSIYNTDINGQNVQTALSFNPGASSTNNNIRKNWIGGSSAQCGTGGGVTYWGNSITSSSCTEVTIKAIEVNAGTILLDSNNVSNIYLQGCDYVGFVGMHIQGATAATVTNNVFGTGSNGQPDNTKMIRVAGGGCTSCPAPGYIYGIWNQSSSATATTYDRNDFYYLWQSGAYWGGAVQCLVHQAASPVTVTNNRINGPQATGLGLSNSFGIRIEPTTSNSGNVIEDNFIAGPYINGGVILGNDPGSYSANVGIGVRMLSSRTVSGTMARNVIWDLRNGEYGGYGAAEGIFINGAGGGNGNWDILNNQITLKNNGSTTNCVGLYGIDVQLNSASTTNINYNTVYISGSNGGSGYAGADFGSYAYLRLPNGSGTSVGDVVNMRNNIFINWRLISTVSVSGHYAIGNYGTSSFSTNWSVSNYNFLAVANGSKSYLGVWGTSNQAALSNWQTASGKDASSYTATYTASASNFSLGELNADNLFINPLSDLHISTVDGQSVQFVDARATPIAITSDFDGETRNGTTPDIGADEINSCAAPVVTTAPSNQNICEGANAQFVVVNSGQAPFTYQWQVNTGSGWNDVPNTAPYSGFDNDTLTITGVTSAMNGYLYQVIITNACGNVSSNSATLTIIEAPEITAHSPISLVNDVCAGSNTGFGVTATGAGLAYAWEVSTNSGTTWTALTNVAPYSGVGTASLVISNTPSSLHSYLYRAIVTGTCSPADTSSAMTLNVGAVAIGTQPVATTTICDGGNGIIFVGATGNALTYQWQLNTGSGWNPINDGGVYSGTNNDTLTITGATLAMNSYQYRVIVGTVACSALTSNVSTLSVPAAPVAYISGSTTICSGASTTINFSGTANATITYTINGGSNQTITLNGSGTAPLNTGALSVATTYALVSVNNGTCTASVSGNAVVSINPEMDDLLINAASVALCSGNGTTVTISNGPAFGEVVYTINGGAHQYATLNGSGSVTLNTGILYASRTYTLVSVADEFCEQEMTATVTVTVTGAPEANAGADLNVSCAATTVTLSAATATNAASILWSSSGDGTFNDDDIQNPVYTFGANDDETVTLTMTVTGAAGCGSAADEVVINIAQANLYVDADLDGYGAGTALCECPEGETCVTNNTDFCDSNPLLNPTTAWWLDVDNDGYGSYVHQIGDIGAGCDTAYITGVGKLVIHGNDCNDSNPAVNPGAMEICWNGIDDNCNGLQNEGGCPIIPPPSNDNPAAGNPNLGNALYVYPNCINVQGTTVGATVSMQADTSLTGRRDVWYQFTAISSGVSIKVSSAVIAPNIYLFSGTVGNLLRINSETIVGAGNTAILNYGGLTSGQTYRIAIGSATLADGVFSLCLQQLKKPVCGAIPNSPSLCSSFTASPTGAATTTYSFSGAGSAESSGAILLSNPALELAYGTSYTISLTANYALVDGQGNPDPIQVPNVNACTVTIGSHPDVQVKVNQRCANGATLYRSAYLQGTPTVCGATGYRVEFTKMSGCSGDSISPSFTKDITSSLPSIYLSYAFGQIPVQGNSGTGHWRVRWKPLFANNVEGTFGTAQIIAVNSTSPPSGMVLEPADNSTSTALTSNVNFGLYPNPNTGDMVNLNITGITSDNVFVRIMDCMGRVIYSNRYAVDGSLNTVVTFSKPLASGLYMVEFTEGNNVVTRRMMVTR